MSSNTVRPGGPLTGRAVRDPLVAVESPAPRQRWREILAASDRALPEHDPAWTDAMCATDRYRDASRHYLFDDGTDVFRSGDEGDAGSDDPGDFTLLAEVLVPFDPALRQLSDAELAAVPVERTENGPEVVETVTVDAHGIAAIRIECPEDGFEVTATVNVGE